MTQNQELAVVALVIALPLFLWVLVYMEKKCCRIKIISEPLPEEGRVAVWSISVPDTELPSYEELQAKNPEDKRPPSYWSLFPYKVYYVQPVITETL